MHATWFTLPAVLAIPAFLAARSDGSIGWKNYSPAAWSAARSSGRPLLVEVGGDWCPPCRRMEVEVWNDPRIISASRKFVCVTVRVEPGGLRPDQEAELGLRGIRVSAYPATVILDPWREVLVMDVGFVYPAELLAQLREIPPDYEEVRQFREALLVDRDNSRALARVAGLYEKSTAFGLANRYYREALKRSGAREDSSLREALTFGIAANEMRRSDWKAGQNAFEHFRREFPDSARQDQTLLGLIVCEVRQDKIEAALGHLAELRNRFPASRAIAVAEGLLAHKTP